MKLLFLFMDGVGLGNNDPEINPLARAHMPNLAHLLGGQKMVAAHPHPVSRTGNIILDTQHASLLALDATMGIDGAPQSASGQAALLTGKNISAILGYHDGPKPNPAIMNLLKEGTLFSMLTERNFTASLLNAYPPRYFASIENGYRLPGAIALSAKYAGIPLKTLADLLAGNALSADFTGQGWKDHLGFTDIPVLSPNQAGEQLHRLSQEVDLTFFEYWLSDVAGHQQNMQSACVLLETIDSVLGGWLHKTDDTRLLLVTSDHGNLEDISTRHHTRNDVPLLLVGPQALRQEFIKALSKVKQSPDRASLMDVTPAIIECMQSPR